MKKSASKIPNFWQKQNTRVGKSEKVISKPKGIAPTKPEQSTTEKIIYEGHNNA